MAGLKIDVPPPKPKRKHRRFIRRWNTEKGYLEKSCSSCHAWYPATAAYFYRDASTSDGLQGMCKLCKKDIDRYYELRKKERLQSTQGE